MIWLLSCIALTSSFFVFFKYFKKFELNTFQAIVFNYLTCAVVGFIFAGGVDLVYFKQDYSWVKYAILLGALFISSFFLMAKTAQEVSVAVSTVASKMSMIIPSGVAIYLFQSVRDQVNYVNLIGLVVCLLSLVLVTYTKSSSRLKTGIKKYLLVVCVFAGSGLVDTLLNLAEHSFPDEAFKRGFPIFCFFTAFIFGVLVNGLVFKTRIQLKNVLGGIALGVPNYFSIYTLFKALDSFNSNAAYVFPIINIGVIIGGSLLAFLFFNERLKPLNYLGVALSLIAIFLLSY